MYASSDHRSSPPKTFEEWFKKSAVLTERPFSLEKQQFPDFDSILQLLDGEIFLLNKCVQVCNERENSRVNCFEDEHGSGLLKRVNDLEEELRIKDKEIQTLSDSTQEYAKRLTSLEENENKMAQKDEDIQHLSLQLQKYADIICNLNTFGPTPTHLSSSQSSHRRVSCDESEPEVTKSNYHEYDDGVYLNGRIRELEKELAECRKELCQSKEEKIELRKAYDFILQDKTMAIHEIARLQHFCEKQNSSSEVSDINPVSLLRLKSKTD